MSTGKPDRGFTIVEVLMFLAVTGVLITIAMSNIGGSRQKAEFSASVRDFNSAIQGIISEVRTGYFPNKTTQVKCQVISGSILMTGLSTTQADQGAHPDCVFLGKVLHFGYLNASNRSASATVITVAGKAFDAGNPPTSYAASKPKPVAGSYADISLNETLSLTNGLHVTKVISRNSTDASGIFSTPNAFGVFNSLIATGTSGSLSANAVTIPGSTNLQAIGSLYSEIVAIGTGAPEPAANPVIAICLQHGGINGKRAVVIIGSRDRSAYSVLHIDDFAARLEAAIPGAVCTW